MTVNTLHGDENSRDLNKKDSTYRDPYSGWPSLRRAGYRRTCSCVRLWVIPKFRRGNSGCRRLERKLIDVDSGALKGINEACRVPST